MVYVYSVYSKYDYKITKYKYFVRIIQFNFDTYKYEVIFEFPNNDLLSKLLLFVNKSLKSFSIFKAS